MTSAGVISGTISASCSGTYTPTFTVTDSGTPTALKATQQLTMVIAAATQISFTGSVLRRYLQCGLFRQRGGNRRSRYADIRSDQRIDAADRGDAQFGDWRIQRHAGDGRHVQFCGEGFRCLRRLGDLADLLAGRELSCDAHHDEHAADRLRWLSL